MSGCIFCKIVSGEKEEEVLHEDEKVFVHRDIYPRAKVHLLITTKKHFDDYSEMISSEPELLIHIGQVVEKMAKKFDLADKSYTWGFHSGVKQSVHHLHAQLLNVEGDELVL